MHTGSLKMIMQCYIVIHSSLVKNYRYRANIGQYIAKVKEIIHISHVTLYVCIITWLYEKRFLTSVLNNSSSFDNCTIITINWDHRNVDIRVQISYNILLIYDDVNKMSLQNVSINGNEYKHEDQELFHHCYTYTIYGINELGEGDQQSYLLFSKRLVK